MKLKIPAFFYILTSVCFSSLALGQSVMDLSGPWRFRLDPDDVGKSSGWYREIFSDSIQIPGVLQNQGYGNVPNLETPWIVNKKPMERMSKYPNWYRHPMFANYREPENFTFPYWFQPERHYVGVAWYQTEVIVPESWNKKSIKLFLERCRWVSSLWLNGEYIGCKESLGTPHEYEVGEYLRTGANRITIRVDGTMVYNLGEHAHSVSDQTQISWNGIIGKVQLLAEEKNILKDVQAYPNLKTGDVRIELELNQQEISSGDYRLVVSGRTENSQTNKRIHSQEYQLNERISYITVALGKDFLKWDEFNPNLYRLDFDVVNAESRASLQKRSIRIGMREIKTRGGYFMINGNKAYLRGTLNCAEFPLKGYPDMDIESWSRIFRACRDYGLNHVRFHSWCPPAAAFVAADELGIYLQPEVSEWVYVAEPDQLNYLKEESLRMLKTYGNHPSFVFMGLGNEAGVIPESRNEFIELWGKDDRRLYTLKANANSSFTDAYDYQIARAIDDKKIRIQSGWPPKPTGSSIVVNAPNTAYDYSDITSTRDYPLVAHETVQRCVFPDTAGLDKFTGHLRAGYLEIAQDQLAERGMSELVPDFVKASGKWQVQQFKDEIEAHLRTEPFGGFQLLSLQDFPGQGTALVGVLDLFWESKGYVSGEAFREFCSPTVPLALFEKRIFVNVEPIEGDVEISYYGPVQSPMVEINVRLLDQHGKVLKSICAGEIVLSRGINKVGDFKFNVEASEFGQKLTVVIECDGDVAGINRWNIWQFPDVDVPAPGKEILIAEKPTRKLMDQVESGSTVLLMPELKTIRGDIPQCFTSMYWNCPWTDGGETHTLGILCNEKHPVFKWFPTDEHTDWQWWSLLTKSRPMILDEWGLSESWPKSHSPIIQPIDGWNLNRKLSVLSECKVGKGRLLICSIDLKSDLDERPAARAMLKGILSYMESDSFNPSESLEAATVLKMFKD